jgi:hypothetical protein
MQTVLLTTEFGNLMAWDGRSKADVDRHFSKCHRYLGDVDLPR